MVVAVWKNEGPNPNLLFYGFIFFFLMFIFHFILFFAPLLLRIVRLFRRKSKIRSEEDKLICMQRRYHHSHKAIFELREEPGDDICIAHKVVIIHGRKPLHL